MENPTVRFVFRDSPRKVVYEICALRDISQNEALQVVRVFNSTRGKAPKKGSTVRILTSIGAHD